MSVPAMCVGIGFVFLFACLQFQLCACLECYSCTDATVMANCKIITKCPTGFVCHASWKSNKFSLGCIASTLCSVANGNGNIGSLVGRSLSKRTHDECSECCKTSNCNRKLCQIAIDGGWSIWTGWSSCSVTCSNGISIRTRSCSSPTPVNGGSDCTGVSHETRVCSMDRCPVNGGWSQWSSWGSCSVTCGIGLQRRGRSCSNPYPSNSGVHCFGDSRDDRICLMGGCQDGGWTDWSGWSTCSTTCGPGLQSSSRSCTNPAPSLLGKACVGDNVKVQSCSMKTCVDGGWTAWSGWSTCSTTCGPGLQTSSRSCTNPAPSRQGKTCVGDGNKVQICTVKLCHDNMVGFTVSYIRQIGADNRAIYHTVISNQGGGYNKTTGVFTCSVPGMYVFTLNIVKTSSATSASCYMYKNKTGVAQAWTESTGGNAANFIPASASVYIHLGVGDTVIVKDCSAFEAFSQSTYGNSFTGYLVHAD